MSNTDDQARAAPESRVAAPSEFIEKPILRPFLWVSLLFAALGLTLAARPDWDFAISAYFAQGQAGFPLAEQPVWAFIFDAVDVITRALALLCLIYLIYSSLKIKWLNQLANGVMRHRRRVAAFLLLAMVLGPGLIAHDIVKRSWDRARPRDIVEFGGPNRFTPALSLSTECSRNCSFVSGHAAAAFFPLVFAWLGQRRVWLWLIVAGVSGLLIGYGRVMVGAHFASDVAFAWFPTLLGAWIAALVVKRFSNGAPLAGSLMRKSSP